MSRLIQCADCGIDLGEIRDAKLRKNIFHLCNVCRGTQEKVKTQVSLLIAQMYAKGDKPGSTSDMFGDVFGEIFGKRR